MRFTINPETLSDGSTVYNVVGRADDGSAVVTFGATDREHAARLSGALSDCAWVDVDVEAAARTGTQAAPDTTIGDICGGALDDRNND
jgi:hypothetical protein